MKRIALWIPRILVLGGAMAGMAGDCDVKVDDGRLEIETDDDFDVFDEDDWEDLWDD